MAELNFETGVVKFTVNGKYDVFFNPTDISFAEKLFRAFDTLDKRQNAYKDEISKVGGGVEIFEIGHKLDAEMREIIDGVFGCQVCDSVFEGLNAYAMSGGLPIWCNFLLSVMDEVDSTFAREQKATNSRVQKYTAKYHR